MKTTKKVSYREMGEWDVVTHCDVGENGSQTADAERIMMTTLCVIRDELKVISRKLNALECGKFLDIPNKLERIKRNTARKRKPKIVGKPKLRVVR